MSADLESARLEWEHAYRDFAEVSRDPALEERVRMQLDAVTTELRRRVGGTFTLRELADEYVASDGWARESSPSRHPRLAAHAGARRRRGIPSLRAWRGRLRAVTMLERTRRQDRDRRSRRERIGRVLLILVGLGLAFVLGMAFAQTLDDRPSSSGAETNVRTLTPLPQEAPVRTVTVTVTNP